MTIHSRTFVGPPVAPSDGALSPLPLSSVSLDNGFWGDRQDLNSDKLIPHALLWEAKSGVFENFVRALDGSVAELARGQMFADSDAYKLVEAMAWDEGRTGDPSLEAEIQRIGALIEAAQCSDGYINTRFGRPRQEPRYSNFEMGHELYCVGHLLQAAVARLRTGRDDDDVIVRVAKRAADHLYFTFGPDGQEVVCGHPEIELALAEFGRAMEEDRYIQLAKLFVDRRGNRLLRDNSWNWGLEYYQDETPFREASVMRGHAVRALYLCAGAIDVAVETGDQELLDAARRQYDNTIARRTYITGGMGSHHADEGFGADFELPDDRSYCETCAGIGSVMCAWRLLLATGDSVYGDIIERTLFNMLAVGMSEDAQSFFYANTLYQREPAVPVRQDIESKRALSQLRAPWFEVSCCPTNIARTLATIASVVATHTEDTVQIHQYFAGSFQAELAAGKVDFSIDTAYPFASTIAITVNEAPSEPITISLRIPAWAQGATVNGEPVTPGIHDVTSVFEAGSQILLRLPLTPSFTRADSRINTAQGKVALEVGPLVYCVESRDLPQGVDVNRLEIITETKPQVVIPGRVRASGTVAVVTNGTWPYATTDTNRVEEAQTEPFDVDFVPYYYWGNRGETAMRVWIPEAK